MDTKRSSPEHDYDAKQKFGERLGLGVTDIYALRESRSARFSSKQHEHMDQFDINSMTKRILQWVPTSVQEVLGSDAEISISAFHGLASENDAKPSPNAGIYVGIGTNDAALPCIYTGKSRDQNGTISRTNSHANQAYRKSHPGKLFYICLDDPTNPRDVSFFLLFRLSRLDAELLRYGDTLLHFLEQLATTILGTMDPPREHVFLVNRPGTGCIPLFDFLPTNCSVPIFEGSHDMKGQGLSVGEAAAYLSESRNRLLAGKRDYNATLKAKRQTGDARALAQHEIHITKTLAWRESSREAAVLGDTFALASVEKKNARNKRSYQKLRDSETPEQHAQYNSRLNNNKRNQRAREKEQEAEAKRTGDTITLSRFQAARDAAAIRTREWTAKQKVMKQSENFRKNSSNSGTDFVVSGKPVALGKTTTSGETVTSGNTVTSRKTTKLTQKKQSILSSLFATKRANIGNEENQPPPKSLELE
jgi:hypothetical protein